MYNILVLGSEGVIGSALTEELHKAGFNPVHYDIVLSEYEDLRRMDNMTVLQHAISKADFVYFLAFDIGGSEYMERYQDSYQFISNNVKIMNNVFSILQSEKKPFIFASSQMSNMSYSTYGILKAIGEAYTNSLGGINAKFWNVYNVETDDSRAHVIHDFLKMARKDGKIIMRTDGMEERQFLHAKDSANALISLQEKYTIVDRNESIDITSFEWNSIIEVADVICDIYGGCEIVPNDNTDTVQRNARNEPNNYMLRLGWTPKIGLKEGIRDINSRMFKQRKTT